MLSSASSSVKYLKSIKFRNKTVTAMNAVVSFVLLLSLIQPPPNTEAVGVQGSCPSMCTCKWKGGKETAECIDRNLITIPDNIDPSTQVLDMSSNNIQILPREIFKRATLLNLQKIYLRDCRLGQIDFLAFTGLTNLVELDLSHNLLTSIPTETLTELPSLRDLTLASNPIQKIDNRAFIPVPHMVKLDLSHCEIQTIAQHAFEGLKLLHTLKLNGNKLTELRAATIESLEKLRGIELHDNPWMCDCRLRAAKLWLTNNNIPFTVAPVCASGPEHVIQRNFAELHVDDFACRPEMGSMKRFIEAGAGDNATIICKSHAVPSPRINWYWNGRPLVNNSIHNGHQRVYVYEEGNFEKHSKLIITNAQETDSSEFYCVATNAAGNAEANFTLHVSLKAAGIGPLSDKKIAGLSAALVILILFILMITGFLLIRLRRIPISESKTPGQMEVITSVSPNNVNANGKVPTSPGVNNDHASPEHKGNDMKVTNPIQKPPRLTDLPYSTNNYEGNGSVIMPPNSSAFGSPTASGNNPDLINDTRGLDPNATLADNMSSAQSTTIQMANLLAEMQLQHQQQKHQQEGSGDYSRAGCDSLYPSGIWDTNPNLTNLLLNAHNQQDLYLKHNPSTQMNGYTNSCYNDKLSNMNEVDDVETTITADYLSRTFPRTSLNNSCNNNSLTNSYHHHLQHNNTQHTNGSSGGYPIDYGLPIVPGAEQLQSSQNKVLSSSGGSLNASTAVHFGNNNLTTTTTTTSALGTPPLNAKTLRVWQKGGVPVLPPVTALKRALTNSRNSPDEGYQEGCGTDV